MRQALCSNRKSYSASPLLGRWSSEEYHPAMMRTIQRVALLACSLLIASCTSGSEVTQPVSPTASEVVPTETPSVVAEPTATPTPEPIVVTEGDRIAAALAAFEADPRPSELIAYDYLEPLVSTNQIRLTVCGWTGETVFDDVYQITYRVGQTRNDNGEIDVAFESANTTPDTCTNTELIETALQATRDYDNYWTGVTTDPTTFDQAEASSIMALELIDFGEPLISDWIAGGLSFQGSFLDGQLPGSGITELLSRTYVDEDLDIFEIIACRVLPQSFGLYQGDVLVDDFREGSSNGPDATAQYVLIRRDSTWKVLAVFDRVWVDCNSFSDGWLAGINRVIPDPAPWETLQ